MKTEIKKITNFRFINYIILLISSMIRLVYILITTVGDRQHDLGYATLLDDGLINPGHLGYIEYLIKFRHLPDFDPFSIFSYYHPPVHHIIAAIFVKAANILGFKEPQIYEAIQIPCLIYSIITIIIAYNILKLFTDDEKLITLPLIFICFNPSLIYMTGSVNNDMGATMTTFLAVYLAIKWFKNGYQNKHLYMLALCMGVGMIFKPTIVVMACPIALVMLMHFISEIKLKNTVNCIKKYIIFAILALPIGLSWTIRNIIRFGVTPGIPSLSETSSQYLRPYPIWEVLGVPVSSAILFPFHSENAAYCHNVWQIMIKTMLFTEIWPGEMSSFMLNFCRITYVVTCILVFVLFILSIIKPIRRINGGDTAMGVFLLTGILALLGSYVFFVLKYPHTCSCDFRYIPVSLVFFAIAALPLQKTNK